VPPCQAAFDGAGRREPCVREAIDMRFWQGIGSGVIGAGLILLLAAPVAAAARHVQMDIPGCMT